MTATAEELRARAEAAFKSLCDEHPPNAFIAVTVGEDLMVNFAMLGLDTKGAVELLQHMIEYLKEKNESEDEFGRSNTTKIH